MIRHSKNYLHKIEKYICIIALIVCVGGLAYTGFYLYTGKGWLLLERKETLSDFYFNRGMYYFNGGAYNLETARTGFEEALAHANGMYPFAYYQLSRTYFITGDFSSALIEADAELAHYPDHFRMHYVKGLIYGYRKQYIQAEQEFKLFNKEEPYPTWAGYNDLAWIYFSEGDYTNAAATALQGLSVKPQVPYIGWLENSYGIAELNLGKYSTAEKYLTLAQQHFTQMTEAEWGIAYPGNDPTQYGSGLDQTRAAITENLTLVHSKLVGK